MEQKKEHNKGDRPRKEETKKLKYRVAVKMTASDYFRLLTRAYKVGVSPSEYMRECFRNGQVKERLPFQRIQGGQAFQLFQDRCKIKA